MRRGAQPHAAAVALACHAACGASVAPPGAPQSVIARPLKQPMRWNHSAQAALVLVAMASSCALRQADEEHASRITRSFPTDGVTKVIVRAARIEEAVVTQETSTNAIELSGVPSGGAKGYHSPDPKWRETPPGEWGLDFVAQRHGDVLIISSRNEIGFTHHHYVLGELRVRVPAGIELLREPRHLTGDGTPDCALPQGERPNPTLDVSARPVTGRARQKARLGPVRSSRDR